LKASWELVSFVHREGRKILSWFD